MAQDIPALFKKTFDRRSSSQVFAEHDDYCHGSQQCPCDRLEPGETTSTHLALTTRIAMPRSLYLNDLQLGQTWTGGPIVMTEADIIRFATEFDPQPMHIDAEAAAEGRFGGLIASGWHIAAVVMRDFVEKAPFGDTPMLGLKVDDLQWRYPVRPGDVLSVTREIVHLARSRSKPDRGIVSMQMTVTNQDAMVVMSFLNLIQMPTVEPRTGSPLRETGCQS